MTVTCSLPVQWELQWNHGILTHVQSSLDSGTKDGNVSPFFGSWDLAYRRSWTIWSILSQLSQGLSSYIPGGSVRSRGAGSWGKWDGCEGAGVGSCVWKESDRRQRGAGQLLPTWLRGKKEGVFLKISSIYQRKKVFFLILDFCACRQTLKFSPVALGSLLYETIDFCGGFQ